MDLQLHQALFGYDAGHHLLESSVAMPPEAVQVLAIATDLSGSASSKGFDSAITGLPLSGTDYYALFCTWLAPEMRRPGCVWSHVLLIEMTELAGIEDLGVLRELFRRPQGAKATERYGKPLRLRSASAHLPPELELLKTETAVRWLAMLYGSPDKSVVVPATSARQHEELVFAVWSQQWPRLRRNFRFSTGSFGDRGRGGNAFDLQVAPDDNRRVWHSGEEYGVVEDLPVPVKSIDRWLHVAAEDLVQPEGKGFRKFLRANGADVQAPRAAFAKLARSFVAEKDTTPSRWSDVLAAVAQDFPAPGDAVTLKRSLLLPSREASRETQVEHAWWSLRWLFEEGGAGAFGQVGLNYEASVSNIWPAKRNELAELLVASPQAAGEQRWSALAAAVAATLDGRDLAWLWEKHPALMPALVRAQPRLAAKDAIWQLSERAQWRVVEALESQPVEDAVWAEIATAMLTAGTRVAVREIARIAGNAAFRANLQWTKSRRDLPPVVWRDALAEVAQDRTQHGHLGPDELAFCLMLLPQVRVEQLDLSREDVRALSNTPLELLPEALQLPTAFFLVALGLKGSGAAAAAALSRGFFAVHGALAEQAEPPESWRLLQRQLPPFRIWDWDRCGKLRESVRSWVHRNQAESLFVSAAHSSEERALSQSLLL